jgi:hypothetical protein
MDTGSDFRAARVDTLKCHQLLWRGAWWSAADEAFQLCSVEVLARHHGVYEGGGTMAFLLTARGENPALSYRNLRAIIGYIGLTLPVVLLLAGLIDGHLESSVSAYYYTNVGNVFTGALCVIGVFLLAYRLTEPAIDNIVTTVAGVAAPLSDTLG